MRPVGVQAHIGTKNSVKQEQSLVGLSSLSHSHTGHPFILSLPS